MTGAQWGVPPDALSVAASKSDRSKTCRPARGRVPGASPTALAQRRGQHSPPRIGDGELEAILQPLGLAGHWAHFPVGEIWVESPRTAMSAAESRIETLRISRLILPLFGAFPGVGTRESRMPECPRAPGKCADQQSLRKLPQFRQLIIRHELDLRHLGAKSRRRRKVYPCCSAHKPV